MPDVRDVLDSWAVLALLQNERAAARVEAALTEATESGSPLLMSVVNAGEVWYQVAREHSAREADSTLARLRQIGVVLVDADWALARVAADFKSRFRLAYGDCFAAALAKMNGGQVLTGDLEFRRLESEVQVQWLPR